jgi:hypothetical protein
MTTQQVHFFNAFYLVVFVVVALLTRANRRRIAGALAGGVAGGLVGAGLIVLWETVGWWHFIIPSDPYFQAVLWIGVPLAGFVFLITWRIARRFGRRGLGVLGVGLAIIGPPRDYWYMQHFPEWGSYAPGVAPLLAVSVTYVLACAVGHGMMRLVAGPARGDRLARRPWEA